MRYMKVEWIHEFPDEPTLLYSEIERGLEVRKVECYRDGRQDFASATSTSGSTGLSEELMPAVSDLEGSSDFRAEEVSQQEFERVWTMATTSAH